MVTVPFKKGTLINGSGNNVLIESKNIWNNPQLDSNPQTTKSTWVIEKREKFVKKNQLKDTRAQVRFHDTSLIRYSDSTDLDFTSDFRSNHNSPCPIQIKSSICNSSLDKNLPNISFQTSLDTECAFVPKKPIQSNTYEMKDFTETVKLYYGDLGQWFPKFGDITHFLNYKRPVPIFDVP